MVFLKMWSLYLYCCLNGFVSFHSDIFMFLCWNILFPFLEFPHIFCLKHSSPPSPGLSQFHVSLGTDNIWFWPLPSSRSKLWGVTWQVTCQSLLMPRETRASKQWVCLGGCCLFITDLFACCWGVIHWDLWIFII